MRAEQIIAYAYYISGINSRLLSNVEGDQGRDGLLFLNILMQEQAATARHIPYYQHISINLVSGQQKYFIPDLIQIDVASFNIQSVRYEMYQDNRNHYWGAPRIDNIEALPFTFYPERAIDPDTMTEGTNIFVYWLPQSSSYILNITGQFKWPTVTMNSEMDALMPSWYQQFLMYELANSLCDVNTFEMPPNAKAKLISLRRKVTDINPIDMTGKKTATLSTVTSMSYAQANFGKGWVP